MYAYESIRNVPENDYQTNHQNAQSFKLWAMLSKQIAIVLRYFCCCKFNFNFSSPFHALNRDLQYGSKSVYSIDQTTLSVCDWILSSVESVSPVVTLWYCHFRLDSTTFKWWSACMHFMCSLNTIPYWRFCAIMSAYNFSAVFLDDDNSERRWQTHRQHKSSSRQ